MAWAPDGRMFVAEKDGNLKVVAPGASTAILVRDYTTRVNSHHDRGLLGLAVDSRFAQHPYLYLLYTYELNQIGTRDSASPMVSQLLRVRIDAANAVSEETAILGTRTDGVCPPPSNAVDCIPSEGRSHSIGTVRSAPDGTLWVGSGDAASYSTVDPLALRTYDEASLAGKLMHVDRNGMGLPGHAFCPAEANLSKVCTKLHAKGFRNPFRFSLQPGGGITLGDVGWNEREEIDLIGAGGKSYGWPCYEGTIRTPGYEDLAACEAEYANGPDAHVAPDHDYPHDDSSSVMGGPTYTGLEYPAGYRDSIFFGDYSGGFVKRLVPKAGGGHRVEPFAGDWAGTALEEAPSGDLAYVSFGWGGAGEGSVRRIVYTPGNARPLPEIEASPTAGPAPLAVSFDGRDSSDPDGDPLSYTWDFGDGSPHSSDAAPAHGYSEPGTYRARLTVSDGRGKSASTTLTINAGNTPPELAIAGDASYRAGESFDLGATASDDQDGTLPDAAIDWDVRVIHADHTHFAGTQAGVAELRVEAVTDHDADSHYEVVASATDSHGATTRQTVVLHPETTTVALRSEPPGAELSYGGSPVTAPADLITTIGFRTSVSAAATLVEGGSTLDFVGWSDGGARVHDYTVPPGGGSLTASYQRPASALPEGGAGQGGAGQGGAGQGGAGDGGDGTAADRSGPVLQLSAVNARRGRFRGWAVDEGGVRLVQLALRRRLEGGDCRWWLAGRRRLSVGPRSCRRPRWLTAELLAARSGTRWIVKLGRRLPPGSLRLLVRAYDEAGNSSRLRPGPATLIRVSRR